MSNCEKCDQFDETTDQFTVLGIPCDLCRHCYRSWVRIYHKSPKTIRFEILTERMNFLRASQLGKPMITVSHQGLPVNPYTALDILVEEREAVELSLIEDTLDWLEETI